ncbi:MAG TPA: prenyltransferase/squalene oxidase repeat-containing protein, partial [Gemmataceae bacterium]|nr:prenyltransferase/squalene oxidase repeat-containing protein [Gemmataceae bacterium]
EQLLEWILKQQMNERHPYTGAEPGGWGWSHLSGSVPDCDDTAGALIAIANLCLPSPALRERGDQGEVARDVALGGRLPPSPQPCPPEAGGEEEKKDVLDLNNNGPAGLRWLVGIQNWDGGFPTFCRGWGRLPFDRSGTDLTAHALRALFEWGWRDPFRYSGPIRVSKKWRWVWSLAFQYLERTQRTDGSWLPLWFGNQHAQDDMNPTYGTARVLAAYRDIKLLESEPAQRGIRWLLANQNPDGGWGGCLGCPSTVEETALAVEGLLDLAPPEQTPTVERGLQWLIERIEAGGLYDPAPIGFYFAKLWYFEKMYPIVWSVAALGRALRKAQGLPSLGFGSPNN